MTPQERYRIKHRDRCRASRKASYAKNPETERKSSEQWRQNNIEKVKSGRRKWYAANVASQRAYGVAKQAARRSGENGFTEDDLHLIWELQFGLCFYCGLDTCSRLEHADHFIPLALGGSNARRNIVISCSRCNLRKGKKHPAEFMGPFQLRHPPLWDEPTT